MCQVTKSRHLSSRSNCLRETSPKGEVDEEGGVMVIKEEEEDSDRVSLSRWRDASRDSDDSRRSTETPIHTSKKQKLDEDVVPRLRLNASLATDPALRPATVAALTLQHDNVSPLNLAPLPAGIQNGTNKILISKKKKLPIYSKLTDIFANSFFAINFFQNFISKIKLPTLFETEIVTISFFF